MILLCPNCKSDNLGNPYYIIGCKGKYVVCQNCHNRLPYEYITKIFLPEKLMNKKYVPPPTTTKFHACPHCMNTITPNPPVYMNKNKNLTTICANCRTPVELDSILKPFLPNMILEHQINNR